MEQFPGHAIRKINSNEFALILYLDDYLTEFGDELGRGSKAKKELLNTSMQIVKERYNGVKVSVVKIIIGGVVVANIQLMGPMNSAKTAETSQIQ